MRIYIHTRWVHTGWVGSEGSSGRESGSQTSRIFGPVRHCAVVTRLANTRERYLPTTYLTWPLTMGYIPPTFCGIEACEKLDVREAAKMHLDNRPSESYRYYIYLVTTSLLPRLCSTR